MAYEGMIKYYGHFNSLTEALDKTEKSNNELIKIMSGLMEKGAEIDPNNKQAVLSEMNNQLKAMLNACVKIDNKPVAIVTASDIWTINPSVEEDGTYTLGLEKLDLGNVPSEPQWINGVTENELSKFVDSVEKMKSLLDKSIEGFEALEKNFDSKNLESVLSEAGINAEMTKFLTNNIKTSIQEGSKLIKLANESVGAAAGFVDTLVTNLND